MTRSSAAVRDLLDETLARPPHERQAFLDKECAGDHSLRVEIDELLAAFNKAEHFLEGQPVPYQSTRAIEPEHRMIGRQIGHYTIRQQIATGGMGAVYEAVQDAPRRIVALKLMKRGIASRSALRRFEHESQIMGRLRHPGIAQVYEAGMHEDLPYFVMEYIPNAATIIDYAQAHKLTTHQRLEVFARVCDAVNHGHQKGVIHRDLKPGNILVDSVGQPKIIDFGVARATDSDMTLTTLQTDVGQLIGTLQYMSPEQCLADPHDLDIRSDVYALGVVMYELLVGRLPYDLSRLSIHEGARLIREQPPTFLSAIDRRLRGDVETIVLKALDKDRTRRYRSAAELSDDIGRYLNQEPISARPPSLTYQFRMFARRNRALVRSAAALFVMLLAALGMVSVFWAQADRARMEASNLAKATVQVFSRHLSNSVALADQAGQKEIAKQILSSAENELKGRFSGVPEVEVQVLMWLGNANRVIGNLQRAEAQILRSIEIGRAALGESHHRTLASMGALAGLYREMTKHDRAEEVFQSLLNVQRRLPNDQVDTVCWHEFADMLHDLGRCAEAEAILRDAIDRRTRRGESVEYHMTDLAGVLRDQGRYAEAEQLINRAIAQRLRHGVGFDGVLNRGRRELGRLFLVIGRFDEARSWQIQALGRFDHDTAFGKSDVDTLLSIELGAMIDFAQGRFEEALPVFDLVAGRAESSITAEMEWWAAHFRTNQAICLVKLQRFDEAEPILSQTYQTLHKCLGDQHHRTQHCLRALIELYDASNRSALADPYRAKLRTCPCVDS